MLEATAEAASLLRRYGEDHWAAWLERDADHIRRGDAHGIRHLLSAFGGMGSLEDVCLAGDGADDRRLVELRGRIYDHAHYLQRELDRK